MAWWGQFMWSSGARNLLLRGACDRAKNNHSEEPEHYQGKE